MTLCIPSSPLSHPEAYCHLSLSSLLLSLFLLFTLPASPTLLTPLPPPHILALTYYELLAALMYSQYSLYHISTAAVCKERDRKKRKGGKGIQKERKRERGWRGDTFVLLISALKDTITSHSILSMFYTSPGPHAFALPRSPHVRPIF